MTAPLTPLVASGTPTGEAPWWSLVIILALITACVFLFRSMSKQLKKVPRSFDEPHLPEPADPADDATALLPHPDQPAGRARGRRAGGSHPRQP